MNPGEAERKLSRLEHQHEELQRAHDIYKEFFEASLAMNTFAAGSAEAVRVRDATNACSTLRIRSRSALDALKEHAARKEELSS
jgi:hypothetical protein